MEVLNTLEWTAMSPVGDIGDFVHPTHPRGKKMYLIDSRSVLLGKKDSPLAEVRENWIKIWDTLFPIETKIFETEECIHYELATILWWGPMMPEKMRLTERVTLNHFWACFSVPDIDIAMQKFIDATRDTTNKIYEDPAGKEENMRWLFIWDANSDNPMFEVVLPHPSLEIKPHFQIDVDTDCPQEEIDTFFPKNFFDWKLNIPDIWTVLQMWTLWNCDAYDIRLGVWNNKRDKMAHRDTLIPLN